MKGRQIVLGQWEGRKAAALLVDGQLDDLLIDPPAGGPPLPGTIFLAVADRPMKGQGGQFVRLPDGARGFLRVSPGLAPGRPVVVQASGYAEPGKAAPVKTRLIFKGRYVILTPGAPGINVSRRIKDEARRTALAEIVAAASPAGAGAILRSAAEFADAAEISAEVAELGARCAAVADSAGQTPEILRGGPDSHTVAGLEWGAMAEPAQTGFAEHGIEEMIEEMRAPFVPLAAGASAWIEPTHALVAVDVNTGGDTSPAAGLKANIALCRDLPRQLRCRGLGGQIVVDFAPFPKRDRRQIEQILRSAMRSDTIETALVGWTPLGHFELQRKRERLPV